MNRSIEYVTIDVHSVDYFKEHYLPFVAKGGIFLDTHAKLQAGDVAVVQFVTHNFRSVYLSIAEVVWVKKRSNCQESRIGVVFTPFACGRQIVETTAEGYDDRFFAAAA